MPLAMNALALERVDQRPRREPGAAAAEVLEDEALQGHAVGDALERKGLDDQFGGGHLWKQPWKPNSLPSLRCR